MIAKDAAVQVVSARKRWAVLRSGATRAYRLFGDEAEAVAFAEQWARRLGVTRYCHRRDGTVRAKDDFR